MSCNAPEPAWFSKERNDNGLLPVVFNKQEADLSSPINIPCGKCLGCKLDKSRHWAIRCTHEASLYDYNSFVTLTYDEEHVPMNGNVPTLRPRDYVLFMKRLRKVKKNVRFFQCGEYGSTTGRPHHHALLFNCHFGDRSLWRKSGDYDLYRSEELERLWPFGMSEIGQVTFQSAGYIARYTTKQSAQLQEGQHPEYLTMSRRPGIGSDWLVKWITDVYPSDTVLINGTPVKPPRFYDNKLQKLNPAALQKIKAQRQLDTPEHIRYGDNSIAREKILRAKQRSREL